MRVDGDRALAPGEELIESQYIKGVEAGCRRDVLDLPRLRFVERFSRPVRIILRVGAVLLAGALQIAQQTEKERHVGSGLQREMQIGKLTGRRTARIDVHNAHALVRRFCLLQALEQHGMAPGEIGADEHDEAGELQILINIRNDVGAKGAFMAGDRGRHAQTRVSVDVRRAHEAFHEFVGDVIIFGEHLTRDVKRDRVRPVLLDRLAKAASDEADRLAPGRARAIDHRMEQPSFLCQRVGERSALDAEAPEICRMRPIARDLHPA